MGWPNIAIVSGGFDPIHIGHIRLLKEASRYGTELWVIVNNDNWLMAKKGFIFMPEQERVEILKHIKHVTTVILTDHPKSPTDMSISSTLTKLASFYTNLEYSLRFCNGGDRKEGCIPTAEEEICKKFGVEMIYSVGGEKIQSSTELARKAGNTRTILEAK